jgi:hypothetical protein
MVSDFLVGILNGLRPGSVGAGGAVRPRPRRIARAPGVTTATEAVVRTALALIVTAGCAVFALNAWSAPTPKKHDPNAMLPIVGAAGLKEVLAIDETVSPRDWQYIVIHHSASTRGSAQSFDQYHRQRGWQGLGYHFVIGNGIDQGDGVTIAGPRWYQQEAGAHAHAALYNEHGIGICLVGNFENSQPTSAQMAALTDLVLALAKEYAIEADHIVGHNQIRQGGTLCPGRFFPLNEFREKIRQQL